LIYKNNLEVVIVPIVLSPLNSPSKQIYNQREYDLINKLRHMLKDLPDDAYRSLNTLVEEQRGERWTDQQLYMYLVQAVADINAEPPHTSYDIDSFPSKLDACVVTGGMIFALIAESILQVGENFSYSDNGISLNINLQQGYQSIAQMLLQGYTQLKKDIKRAMRPVAAGIKSSPAAVRIRSYAPRQWVYR
jgi:hypothetical protein